MKRTIPVFLGHDARRVGTLHFDAVGTRERSAFSYEESWLESHNRFALDPALPLLQGPQFHRKSKEGSVFCAAIADTEPDGWARRVILRDHAKRRQEARKSGKMMIPDFLNGMDFLLAVDDFSRVGALRFQNENGDFCRRPDPGHRTAPPLIELGQLLAATRAVESESETSADLAYLLGRGTSLGGMRPKCTILDEKGMLAIGKFPSAMDERAVTKGEVLAMTLAKAAGMDVAEAHLVHTDGLPVALIKRFDRTTEGLRLMYISAATMIGADASLPREHFYTEIVDAIRMHGADAQSDIEELWRRIAFSILINNVDDHLRNHGFLHACRGQWRLAPAFDLNPFPERVKELKTWISEETGPEATIDALLSARSYFRIAPQRSKEILREVEKAVSKWREVGKRLGLTARELESFADAFEHQERKSAQKAMR